VNLNKEQSAVLRILDMDNKMLNGFYERNMEAFESNLLKEDHRLIDDFILDRKKQTRFDIVDSLQNTFLQYNANI